MPARTGITLTTCTSEIKAEKILQKKMWSERCTMNDDPLMYTIRATLRYNDAVSRYIAELTFDDDSDDIAV